MKAIDLIRDALQFTENGLLRLIDDMYDAPLAQPTAAGGNHTLWVMGHLTFVEEAILSAMFGTPHPRPDWAGMFAPGSKPTDDPKAYPPFQEVVKAWQDARAQTLKRLDEVGDAGLDAPSKDPPKGFADALRTLGKGFMLINLHQMVHYGQITDCRRVAGRKPLM